MKYFSNPKKPWLFFFVNVVLILVFIGAHIFLIFNYRGYLNGNWLTYFVIIEIPLGTFLAFNVAFLCFF
jgi:hypothetical protein